MLIPAFIIYISYLLICSWKVYCVALPIIIAFVGSTVLDFVSVKLSVCSSQLSPSDVVISTLQQVFIFSYQVLLHSSFFGRIRRLRAFVSNRAVVRESPSRESSVMTSTSFSHGVLCDHGNLLPPSSPISWGHETGSSLRSLPDLICTVCLWVIIEGVEKGSGPEELGQSFFKM